MKATAHAGARARTLSRSLPLTLVVLAGLAACDDATSVEEHFEVEGFAIVEDGTELYRYLLEDGAPPTFGLATGVHEVAFVLLDHAGDPIPETGHDPAEGEEEEEEHVLEITIAAGDILTWMPEEHGDDHAAIEFHGELNALQPGATTMIVCVPHGGHCDFERDVPVTVTASDA